jgi:hypothetical protein
MAIAPGQENTCSGAVVSIAMLIEPCNPARSDGSHPAGAFLIKVKAAESKRLRPAGCV